MAASTLPLTALVLLTTPFLVRAFVLMHECGHGSLFRSHWLNRRFGSLLGVFTGMPQFVWSQHHQVQHATNVNWDESRGPLGIVRTSDYAALSVRRQRGYRNARSVWLASRGGLMYGVINPRLNWLKGMSGCCATWPAPNARGPGVSPAALACEDRSPHWDSWQDFRHMSANNLFLIGPCVALCGWYGPALLLGFCLTTMALAGGIGIAVFTVQHNFEHDHASSGEGWDYHRAALQGKSFLVLPGWRTGSPPTSPFNVCTTCRRPSLAMRWPPAMRRTRRCSTRCGASA